VRGDNIQLLPTSPQLRTLLHWRDLFFRAARRQASAGLIAKPVPPCAKSL